MEAKDKVWKEEKLGKSFLEGVRGAIPLANEQIDIMLRIIREARPDVDAFLDLGCGDGVLGRAILANFPDAKGVFLDFSEFMIETARAKTPGNRNKFIEANFGQKGWLKSLGTTKSFDVVVSGFSIHHQHDNRKREIYQEIFSLLNPGGLFLNLEHVASASELGGRIHDDYFIDALDNFHRGIGSGKSGSEVADEYYRRPDKEANILASVREQCQWLEEIGYLHVDCFFKVFELALFGGLKP